jgi:predicted transcriptional regulator
VGAGNRPDHAVLLVQEAHFIFFKTWRPEMNQSEVKNNDQDLLGLTIEIVAAHLLNNKVGVNDLPQLIQQVFQALSGTGKTSAMAPHAEPAVPIKRSIHPDHIVCLEDGKKQKMLKRHLMTAHKLTPEAYRERWGLLRDYPHSGSELCPAAVSAGQADRTRQTGGQNGLSLPASAFAAKGFDWRLARSRDWFALGLHDRPNRRQAGVRHSSIVNLAACEHNPNSGRRRMRPAPPRRPRGSDKLTMPFSTEEYRGSFAVSVAREWRHRS